MTLRRGSQDDAAAIAEIWRLGWRDAHLGFVPRALVDARTEESFEVRASERVGEMTVALVDGAVAGFVLAVGDEIEQVYVSGSHRVGPVSPTLS